MVMGVDEAGQDDMARGVEHGVDALRRLAWLNERRDPRPLDDNPAFGSFGENRQRVLDPRPHAAPAPNRQRLSLERVGRPCQRRTENAGHRKSGRSRANRSPILILFPIISSLRRRRGTSPAAKCSLFVLNFFRNPWYLLLLMNRRGGGREGEVGMEALALRVRASCGSTAMAALSGGGAGCEGVDNFFFVTATKIE